MNHEQAARQLSRTVANREKRRVQEGAQRGEDAHYDNDRPRKRRSEPLKAAQQAYAAVMAAAALAPQPVLRCELCQASFTNEAQLQQHLSGPVHKKAVDKAAREAAKLQHLNQHSAVAQEALAAAAWLNGGRNVQAAAAMPGQQHNRQHQQQQQQRASGKQQQSAGGPRASQKGPLVQRAAEQEMLTHEQVLAQAKQQSGPLTLDGWIPPSIPIAQQQQQQEPAGAAPHTSYQLDGQHHVQEGGSASDGEQTDVPHAAKNDEQHQGAKEHSSQEGSPKSNGGGGGCGRSSSSSGSGSESSSDGDEDSEPQKFESFF